MGKAAYLFTKEGRLGVGVLSPWGCWFFQVWDGTECPHPLLDVSVEPEAQQGSTDVPGCRKNLVASVLVYDDHVRMTQDLKVGCHRSQLLQQCKVMSMQGTFYHLV